MVPLDLITVLAEWKVDLGAAMVSLGSTSGVHGNGSHTLEIRVFPTMREIFTVHTIHNHLIILYLGPFSVL